MGFNIYDELPVPVSKYHGTEKQVLAEIFLQHAQGGVLPVTPWYDASKSLAREFPEQLGCLDDPAILGRDEFVNGIHELLHPTTQEAKTLRARIAKAVLPAVENDFGHVKSVAIIGAGVAGLQVARRLMEIGISCTIFEKSENVGGCWQKNYADFGLQVPKELFEFPDFPYPDDFKCDLFPTGPEVQAYIELYAKTFKLYEIAQFKTTYATYSRFGHWFVHPHHGEGATSTWFHGTCAPVKWLWWRAVEFMFRGQFQIPSSMIPEEGIETDLFSGGQILNYDFRDMLNSGKIQTICGAIDKFTETGVVLVDGKELDADMVIYGTGFGKNYDIFDKVIQKKLNIQKDGLYLYRNVIPPQVPDVAFIGCEVATFNNILTHGLQALWLQKMLSGQMRLPKPGSMEKAIQKEL
ncbi:FMOGS-OX3 [Symbiodinium microadriaticum]|nr:FMOGS-OX3 [Symbiodinium microadriaticum]